MDLHSMRHPVKTGLFLCGTAAVICSTLLWVNTYALDGLLPNLVAPFIDDTEYAAGYSASGFRRVAVGMSESEVRHYVGQPLGESWHYGSFANPTIVSFEASGKVSGVFAAHDRNEVQLHGRSREAVRAALGAPDRIYWSYTRSPHNSSYRVRVIEFSRNRVAQVYHHYYGD